MNSKLKKLLSATLAAVLLASCAACTNSGQSSTAPAGSTPATAAQGSSAPVSDEPVTLKVGYYQNSTFKWEGNEILEDNTWTNLYEDNGIKLEVLYNVDEEVHAEKLAQSILSGVYPDIMKTPSAYFLDWAQQGVFEPLDDIYEQYASEELKAYYGSEVGQKTLLAGRVDGKLYGLPKIQDPYNNMSVLWIRGDWLENVNKEVPKTLEEFEEVARAFTEDDPDRNGQKDTYGLGLNGAEVFHNHGGIQKAFECFGVVPGSAENVVPFVDINGSAIFGGADDAKMKQGLAFYNGMYNKGYIPKDFITAGVDQIRQDASSGRIGMFFGTMSSVNNVWNSALATQPNADFIAVSLPGLSADNYGASFYTGSPRMYFTMSSKCEYPEAFMKIINLGVQYLAQPDSLSQDDYEKYNGLPGTYTGWKTALVEFEVPMKNLQALGRHQKALSSGDTSELNAENLRDFNAMKDYLDNLKGKDYKSLNEDELVKLKNGIFYWSVWGAPSCGYAAVNDMINIGNLQYSAYDTVQTPSMIEYTPALNTLAKETIVNIINGNQPVDSYTSFLDSWKALGGEEIQAEADDWYKSVQ